MPPLIGFAELPNFAKAVHDHLSDEAFQSLQSYLMQHPDAGDLIKDTGGCRKLRWGAEGRGKRGGVRIIYYYRRANGRIWLLTIYAKNETENISSATLRRLREEIDRG
jgi:mRNA-degrading endonuclease RelE of RelBE toxin-antitoxin system